MKTREKMDVQINLDQESQSILNKMHLIKTTYCFLMYAFLLFYSYSALGRPSARDSSHELLMICQLHTVVIQNH